MFIRFPSCNLTMTAFLGEHHRPAITPWPMTFHSPRHGLFCGREKLGLEIQQMWGIVKFTTRVPTQCFGCFWWWGSEYLDSDSSPLKCQRLDVYKTPFFCSDVEWKYSGGCTVTLLANNKMEAEYHVYLRRIKKEHHLPFISMFGFQSFVFTDCTIWNFGVLVNWIMSPI